jgi:hypothetical protein
MKKQILCKELEILDVHYFNDDIGSLINRLQKLNKNYTDQGYVDLNIKVDQHYEDVSVILYGNREETKDEIKLRKQKVKKAALLAKHKKELNEIQTRHLTEILDFDKNP